MFSYANLGEFMLGFLGDYHHGEQVYDKSSILPYVFSNCYAMIMFFQSVVLPISKLAS